MKTAVEWLQEQIAFTGHTGELLTMYDEDFDLSEFFNKALEIEKEQICNAWENGYDELDRAGRTSLNYYHETFKNTENENR